MNLNVKTAQILTLVRQDEVSKHSLKNTFKISEITETKQAIHNTF
jgi:hypothetical protein